MRQEMTSNRPLKMHRIICIILVVASIAGCQVCLGDGLLLSITASNQNVIITWPRTATNLVLIETTGLDTSFVSNGIVYVEAHRRHIIPSSSYLTNGEYFYTVLPIDFTVTNKLYWLGTNDVTPPFGPSVGIEKP
jgi:hypothetical protein